MSDTSNGYMRRSIAIWVLIIAVESLHGTLRQIFLAPVAGEFTARQISVFTGAALIFIVALFSIRWIDPPNGRQAIVIGSVWIILTISFEVGLGLFVFAYPIERILEDYDIIHGGLMGIGLLFMLFTPLAAARLRLGGQHRNRTQKGNIVAE